jgi:hypothetical protein
LFSFSISTGLERNTEIITKLDQELCHQGGLLDQALDRDREMSSKLEETRMKLANRSKRAKASTGLRHQPHSVRARNLVNLALKVESPGVD